MIREIAVFTDSAGYSASLMTAGKITVFRRKQDQWQPVRELDFTLTQARDIREMRRQMAEAIAFLAGCRVFVAQAVSGVPYYELEKAAITVWECAGQPQDFLDDIFAEEAAKRKAVSKLLPIPEVVERAPGRLFISIKDVQENDVGVTTKQLLLPLIRKSSFDELEIICNHVPPWLAFVLEDKGFLAKTEKIQGHLYRLTITKCVTND